MSKDKVKSASKKFYDVVNTLDFISQCLLWPAAFISCIDIFFKESLSKCLYWNYVLNFQALLLAGYSIFVLLSNCYLLIAHRQKVYDNIDNSFGSKLSIEHSKNYYDNEEIKEGLKRLLYNVAESCYFSSREMNYMVMTKVFNLSVPILIFVIGIVFGNNKILLSVFCVSALLLLIVQVIQFFIARSYLLDLSEQMIELLRNKPSSASFFNAKSINFAIQYEVILAWYRAKIPDSVYNKLNKQLTEEWNELKKTFVIK